VHRPETTIRHVTDINQTLQIDELAKFDPERKDIRQLTAPAISVQAI
jgi:hypothetical protein